MANNDKCSLHIPHKMEVEDSGFMQENWLALERWARDSALTNCNGGVACPKFGVYDLSSTGLVAPSTIEDLDWIYSAGDALFDMTTPTQPLALAAGTYHASASVNIDGTGAGKVLHAELFPSRGGSPPSPITGNCPLDSALMGDPAVALSLTYQLPINGYFLISAMHDLAASASLSGVVFVTFEPHDCAPA